MEGVLKQQLVGADGMYTWQRKHYRIDDNGNLYIKALQGNDESVRIPLSGAKYAKEWSFSSALSGFGFDIMWSNDEVWSFLVDDESSCLRWVTGINNAICLQKPDEHSLRGSRDGIAMSAAPHHDLLEEDFAMKTIEKHQQFLSSASNSHNSTAQFNEILDQRARNTESAGFLDDLPIDVKSLRSLHGSGIGSTPGRQRYDNNLSASHHQDDGHDENVNRSSIQSHHHTQRPHDHQQQHGIDGSRSAASAFAPQQNPLNNSQNHMDYFRSDVSKALFDNSGTALYEPPLPPAVNGSTKSPPMRTDQQRNEYLENMKSIFSTTRQSLVDTEQELASLRSSQPNPDHLSLQIRCQHLEQLLQVKDQELEKAQNENYHTKLEFEDRFKKLNDELDGFRNREHDLLAKFKQEIDHRVLRASNENSSYFEASLKSLKAQHQRELRLLQDELNDERKSGLEQVEKEIMLRKRAEASDQSLRKDLQHAQDRIAMLEMDLQRTQATSESSQSAWSREKTRLVAEYTHQIQQLTTEKETIELEAQRQIQSKVQEMNKKWESSLQTLKGHEMELMRQQWESDHARSLIELQKKCQRDIESVRSEERTLAAQEMESLRTAFLQRERQTAQDLIELEKLHAKRVQQLDFQYTQEKSTNEQLKQRLNDLLLDQERKHQDSVYQSDSWQRKTHDLTLQCDQLKRDLKAMQEQVADSKAGENHAREQLRQISMELKLILAERAELQRQVTGNGVEVTQWKQVVHEQEKNYHALETSVRVAKEEVAFLEHENHRLKTENAKLHYDMEKADRLIYGVSQHNADPQRTFALKLDSKFHDVAGSAVPANTPATTRGGTPSVLQQTPLRSITTPSQQRSKLDSMILSHPRQSAHRHSHHLSSTDRKARSKSPPRRSSPPNPVSTTLSARSSSAAKHRWA